MAIALAVTAAALAACANPMTGGGRGSSVQSGPSPRHPQLDPCPARGTPAELARLRLRCLAADGPRTVDVSRLGGRPVLVNLWASWCVPCQQEMPALQRAYRTSGGDVAFLGIDTKDEPNSGEDFLAAFGVTYPQLKDTDGELLASLHAAGLPVTVVLDRDGRIVWRKSGRLREEDLRAALAAALRKGTGASPTG